jgi:hypothetical protein
MKDYCNKLLKNRLSKKEIKEKNDMIYEILLKKFKNKNFQSLNDGMVKFTFDIIDKIYFQSNISKALKKNKSKIEFKSSNKLTKTAGYCKCNSKLDYNGNIKSSKYEIVISKKIVENLFKNKKIKNLKINGLHCKNRLECYINLYQHEITHLLVSIFCPKEGEGMGGHTRMFKALVYALFGHTKYKHWLLEGDSIKMEEEELFKRTNIEIGDIIITKKVKNKSLEGRVIKLGPKNIRVEMKNKDVYNIPYLLVKKIKNKSKKKLIKTKIQTSDKIKKKLKIGMKVLVNIKGKVKEGNILSLNEKRASILFDKKEKWYVPYKMIFIK